MASSAHAESIPAPLSAKHAGHALDPVARVTTGPGRTGLWWNVIAIASIVAVAVVNIVVAQTAIAPRTPWDEIGPLQMARVLAGHGPVAQMSGSGYYPGWAILLTPIWWFTQDPATVYKAAIVVVIVLAMVTIWPAALIARRFGLSTAQSLSAAALASLLPGRTVNADYALSENLLMLCLVLAVLAAFRLWEKPTVMRGLVFVLIVSYAYLTHVRALALVVVAAAWLVLLALRNWRTGLVGLVALVVGYKLVEWLVNQITVPLLLSGFGQGDSFFGNLRAMQVGPAIRTALSQTWGQLAGSFGLVAVGAVALVVLAWRELRDEHRVGPFCFIVGFVAVGFVVSVIPWAKEGAQSRLDAQVYTRYLDPLGFFLVLVALAVLFRTARRWVLWVAGLISLVDVAVVMLKIAPWANTWGSLDGPANSSSVLAWARLKPDAEFAHPLYPLPGNANEFWFWPSITIVCALVVIIILRRYSRILAIFCIAGFTVLSVAANPSQSRDYPAPIEDGVEEIEQASGAGTDTLSVDFDMSCAGPALTPAQVLNWSGYWLAPRDVEAVDPKQEAYDSPLVIACADWPDAEKYGAEYVKGSDFYWYRLWVLPGDQLEDAQEAGIVAEPGS